MTGFNCNVSGSPADATPIAPPKDSEWCGDDPSTCVQGAKRPLYVYNYPMQQAWSGNFERPGYHASWGFPNNGAQNDIFLAANGTVSSTSSSAAPTSTSSSALSSSAVDRLRPLRRQQPTQPSPAPSLHP
ncbi:hypothetical protein JCM10207_004455 [Rhodosporidiobolus poonsookiae]